MRSLVDSSLRPRVTLVLPLLGSAGALPGCAPTLDVAGVYVPGWLISAVWGVAGAYAAVIGLSRREPTRELADSGLFFLGLVVSIALATWLTCYSGF